jgi:DNA (cytosine-5)-methyltransferase 1
LFLPTPRKPYRAAREIIDWTLKGQNIFDRKRPLAAKTMKRIAAGMKKINGIDLEPFLVKLYGTAGTASIEKPLPTVTAGGNHFGLAEPFVLSQASGGAPRDVKDPIPTICTDGAVSLIEPFLVPTFGEEPTQKPRTHSINKPLPTSTIDSAGCLIEPFILEQFRNHEANPIDDQRRTIAPSSGGIPPLGRSQSKQETATRAVAPKQKSVLNPIVIGDDGPERSGQAPHLVDRPLRNVLCPPSRAPIDPFIVAAGGPEGKGRQPASVEEPLMTILTENHQALVEPFVMSGESRRPGAISEAGGVLPLSR